jgi:hypothetical protein
MMFLDCPAYLDEVGAVRWGLPAEMTSRYTLRSTDGLLESAMISCPSGHWFNGPIESLTISKGKQTQPGQYRHGIRADRCDHNQAAVPSGGSG